MSDATKFEGTVVQRSANGSGIVEMSTPGLEQKAGYFSYPVIQQPAVSKAAQVGKRVHGWAKKNGENYKILRIDPK